MIIPNANMNQGASPVRPISDDGPKVVATTPEQITPQQPSPQQLNNAVAAINQAMRQSNQNLEFSMDSSTKRLVVRMVDTATGDVIRQIPSKEVLAIAQSIDEFQQFQQGLLISLKG